MTVQKYMVEIVSVKEQMYVFPSLFGSGLVTVSVKLLTRLCCPTWQKKENPCFLVNQKKVRKINLIVDKLEHVRKFIINCNIELFC